MEYCQAGMPLDSGREMALHKGRYVIRNHQNNASMDVVTKRSHNRIARPRWYAMTTRRLMALAAIIAIFTTTARWLAGVERERTSFVIESGPVKSEIIVIRTYGDWLLGRQAGFGLTLRPKATAGDHR